ncbi:MAG: ATP synthase subunit I [Desulfovibrionaceae bacterium]|nr:ATP synthase subunit I [Desulfovibrionaceae bacterium]
MIQGATRINGWLETALYRRGFVQIEVRKLVRNQIYLAVLSSVLLGAAMGLSPWALSYAAGALLITLGLWSLAKVVQQLIHVHKGGVVPLLIFFYLRLLFAGLALYALIVWFSAPVTGLLAGLSTVLANAALWGAVSFRQKAKEA